MSEKCLLDQWRDMAYDRNLPKDQLEKFWGTYFTIEREIYPDHFDRVASGQAFSLHRPSALARVPRREGMHLSHPKALTANKAQLRSSVQI